MDDLISRSALVEHCQRQALDDWNNKAAPISWSYAYAEFADMVETVPAVDAETVCKQIGLVKEALEMAKADLVAVVRCRDCAHYEFGFCVRSILYSKGPNGYCENGERRSDS